MHIKISCAKRRPPCPGEDKLTSSDCGGVLIELRPISQVHFTANDKFFAHINSVETLSILVIKRMGRMVNSGAILVHVTSGYNPFANI